MQPPADLLAEALSFATSGVINTEVSHTVLASPGVGTRYRVWGWSCAAAASTTGAIRAYLRPGGLNMIVSVAGVIAPQSGGFTQHFPGGIAFPANDSITVRHASNVAAQNLTASVLYTIESVA